MAKSAVRFRRLAGMVDSLLWFGFFLYRRAYFTYKRLWEDALGDLVRRHPSLFRNGHVLDVGAHIGYAAFVLARASDPAFRIYAFEPDSLSVGLLRRTLLSERIADRVTVVNAAAGDREGTAVLRLSPVHPADNRIDPAAAAPTGEAYDVPMVTLDAFVSRLPPPAAVAFVKIDVQGYEPGVVRGMSATLDANPNIAVLAEFDPAAMRAMGEDPVGFLTFFAARGFQAWIVGNRGTLTPFGVTDVAPLERRDLYTDLLFRRTNPA